MVFQRHDQSASPAEKFVRAGVERLGEARVDDGAVEAFRRELLGGLARDGVHRAEAEQRHLAPLPLLEKFWTTSALPISSSFGSAFIGTPSAAPRG
jgi:hypothetical protein